jgi:hypothetical protein
MSAQRVSASLSIAASPFIRGGEPVDARVAVEPRRPGADEVVISIQLESGGEWVLELDPAPAAYLAGTLAIEAGVRFG